MYNYRIVSLFVLVSLSLTGGVFLATASPSGVLQTTSQWYFNNVVAPGQTMEVLEVTITNTYDQTLYGLTLCTNVIPGFFPPTTQVMPAYYQQWDVGNLTPGQRYTFVEIVNVSPNINIGTYNTYLYAQYSLSPGAQPSYSTTVQVPVEVLGYVRVYASASGQLYAGETGGVIDIQLTNVGNTVLTNASLDLPSHTGPIYFTEGVVNISEIPLGNPVTVPVTVNVDQNASVGYYTVKATLQGYGNKYTLYFPVYVASNVTYGTSVLSASFLRGGSPFSKYDVLSLSLSYRGPSPAVGGTGILYLPPGFSNTSGGRIVEVQLPPTQPGGVVNSQVYLNIGNVSPGTYTIPVAISWYTDQGTGVMTQVATNTTATVLVLGEPLLTATYTPDSLTPGNPETVNLVLVNSGTAPAYNVTVNLSPSSGVVVMGGSKTVQEIPAGGSTTLQYQVYVPVGIYNSQLGLQLSVSYSYPGGGESSLNQEIDFFTPAVQVQETPVTVSFSPTTLNANNKSLGYITFTDNGGNLTNASFTVSSPDIFLNQTVFVLREFSSGERASFPVQYYTQVQGEIPFTVQGVFYNSLGQQQSESVQGSVLSVGSILLRVTGVTELPSPSPGTLVSVTATLTNYGSATATAMQAVPGVNSPFKVIGTGSYYIGNLGPDSSTTFTLAFLIPNTTYVGTYSIPVNLIYTNPLNEVENQTVTISLNVHHATNTTTVTDHGRGFGLLKVGLLFSLVIVILVVVVLVVRHRRSNR